MPNKLYTRSQDALNGGCLRQGGEVLRKLEARAIHAATTRSRRKSRSPMPLQVGQTSFGGSSLRPLHQAAPEPRTSIACIT